MFIIYEIACWKNFEKENLECIDKREQFMMNSKEWTKAVFVREPKERILSAFINKFVDDGFKYYNIKCCHRLKSESRNLIQLCSQQSSESPSNKKLCNQKNKNKKVVTFQDSEEDSSGEEKANQKKVL